MEHNSPAILHLFRAASLPYRVFCEGVMYLNYFV